jgi:raffinose/stachyose/melibiose transport system substrate-binding protein
LTESRSRGLWRRGRPRRSGRLRALLATSALALAALTACGGGSSTGDPEEKVIRIAMGSPGKAQMRVWESVASQYEEAHAGWKVEINFMDDDQYQTVGLPNLLNGRQAPDIYFEWVGDRLATRVADGFAADLTSYVDGPLAGIWDPGVFTSATVDGKVSMVPHIADVTDVLWYNKQLFADAGVEPPATIDDLVAACSTFSDEDIATISLGNKDLWPAGNFFATIAARTVGEDVYDSALSGETSFDDPAWVGAFEQIKKIADAGCVNDGANAINDNEGAQLFFQGKAAIHPIGSWIVSWAIDEAPDLDFDFVNVPAVTGGAGDQASVMGVITGYIVNAHSAHVDEAVDFLALLNSKENVDAFIKADAVPLALSAADNPAIDERTARVNALLANAETVLSPPDTGYDIETATALYQAIAAVLGGQATPEEAASNLAAEVS